MYSGNSGRVDHYVTINGIQRLHDLEPGEGFLDLLAQGLRSASLGRNDVGNINQRLIGQCVVTRGA